MIKTSSVRLELTDISDIDEFDSEDQNGDELFTFGKKVKIEIGDMDYKSWRDSLVRDRDILELLTLMVGDTRLSMIPASRAIPSNQK